ncbi:MAG: tyrosine--tRNA ligase [Patescibacteria group bacterium]
MNTKTRFDQQFFPRISESWEGMNASELVGFLYPKCQEIITAGKLQRLLEAGRKLRVKFGIDPTASNIHLGHIVPIMLLNQFAKAGHHIDFIIGDFTAIIGDPTERDTGRVPLTNEQIVENMRTYQDQIGRYIDLSRLHLHRNSEWLNPMTLRDVFAVFQRINLTEAMQREDFRKRMRNEQGVSLAEVCYGVLMGIDSVQLSTDVEIGGIDQLLNFQQCRKIMQEKGIEEEVALMVPLLEGTDGAGRKMSKSFGNTVPVNASLEDKFGKIMSIPDQLIFQYFCSFADVHEREVEALKQLIDSDPMEAKKQLATFLVALEAKDLAAGLQERENFERKFSKRIVTDADCIPLTASSGQNLLDLLVNSGHFKSKGELRRLFDQNAVRLISDSGESILASSASITETCKLRVGKLKFFAINVVEQ